MAYVKSVPASEESVSAVMRRYPDQAIPLTELTEVVMRRGECGFTSEQRELIAAYASGKNDCIYCYNTHKATAEAFGIEQGLLDSMLTDLDASGVDKEMKPVLRFVGKLTESPSKVVQADVDAIFDAGWEEDSFHFAVMICGLFNFYNRLMDGYGVRNTAEFRQSRGAALVDRGYTIVTDALKNWRA